MYSFIKAQEFSAAMEVVIGTWARALRLRREDVMIILITGIWKQGASELAGRTGRARQLVHRNLRGLEKKKIVCPAALSPSGKVLLWELTERGRRIYDVLRDQVAIWEAHLDEVFELESTFYALHRGVAAIVGRPHDPRGWEHSLKTPRPVSAEEVWALEATARLRDLAAEIAAEVVSATPAEERANARRAAAELRRDQEEREYAEFVRRMFNN